MIPAEIQAKSGEKILPKFRKLVAWIDSQRLVSVDDRVTINTTPNGTHVSMVDRPPTIVTPLSVRPNGTKFFSVGEGYINGKLPKIQPSNAALQEIVDPDGVPAPPAKLPEYRPIVICVKVVFDKTFKLESSEIVHKEPKDILRGGSADYSSADKTITGLIPLAFMRSNRFVQFVLHNLQVRAYLHNGSYRVIYWPA
jgi:hypothetical protein